jgi:hypothetical protein
LSPEELEKLASNLTDAQPFIGYLTQNYSLTGLFTILTQALEQQDSVISQVIIVANSSLKEWKQRKRIRKTSIKEPIPLKTAPSPILSTYL